VAIPDVADGAVADKLFGPSLSLAFYLVDEDASAKPAEPAPAGDILLPFDNGASQPEALAVHAPPFMSGERIADARSSFSQTTAEPVISLRFDDAGRDIFARVTRENTMHRIAIAIDGRVVCAPMVVEEITGGTVEINGTFTPEQAIDLAMRLSPSGLPAPVRVVESGIGPLPR
jgi:preprotein translocase subunit SecD